MQRFPDWPRRLGEVIAERAHWTFAWGTHDCALFAADCVLAMTGEDLAADLRGRYSTAVGARRALRHLGYRSLEVIADARLTGRLPARFAQRGDIVLIEQDGAPALAVADGEIAWAASDLDLARVPMERWLTGWKVGER